LAKRIRKHGADFKLETVCLRADMAQQHGAHPNLADKGRKQENEEGDPFLKSPTALAAAVLFLAALVLAACGAGKRTSTTPTARPTTTPPPSATPAPTIASRPTRTPLMEVIVSPPAGAVEGMPLFSLPDEKVLETAHFAFYVDDDYRPVDIEDYAETAEVIYAEVSGNLGVESTEGIILSIHPPQDQSCPARGSAFNTELGPRIIIFADAQTEEAQIVGVLAHEVAHVLHLNGFDRPLAGDIALTEGLATWITRGYWTAWLGSESLDEMVRGYLADGSYVPLAEADVFSVHPLVENQTVADCLPQRNLLYTQWAAFVGYLVDTYGWETFLDLMASAAPEVLEEGVILPKPTDYEGVYGKTLETLEADWLVEFQAEP
jgi:hypothetical protein